MKIVKDYTSQTSAAPYKIVNDDDSELTPEQLAELDRQRKENYNSVIFVNESDLVPNPEP
mgnify:CR=1 FL=1